MTFSIQEILIISVIGGYFLMMLPWIGDVVRRMNENQRNNNEDKQ